MLYLTQLIYLQPGGEEAFEEFEAIVLPLLPKYHGKLLLRMRPDASYKIEGTEGSPYEVHIVRFESKQDMADYSNDPIRQQVLRLKEQSVRHTLVIEGRTETSA